MTLKQLLAAQLAVCLFAGMWLQGAQVYVDQEFASLQLHPIGLIPVSTILVKSWYRPELKPDVVVWLKPSDGLSDLWVTRDKLQVFGFYWNWSGK